MAESTQSGVVHVEYFLLQRKSRLNGSLLLVTYLLCSCLLRCHWLIYTLLNGRVHSNWCVPHGELTAPNLAWLSVIRSATPTIQSGHMNMRIRKFLLAGLMQWGVTSWWYNWLCRRIDICTVLLWKRNECLQDELDRSEEKEKKLQKW